MTITITLSERIEQKLTERAAKVGKPAEALALEFIEQGVDREPTLAEIMAPFAAEVAASGMSDDELEAFFATELADMRREKREASR